MAVRPRGFTLRKTDSLADVRAPKLAFLAAGRQHDAITLIPALLLSINAIASGLRIAG